ncbi:MAG: leucine-rich repeat protein [Paludibacteraceae bacterium]|nr:leucine-rich repeat protein [Paludibacteraceae bacterium]
MTNLTLSKNIVDTGHEAFTSMLNLSSMEILTAKMDTLPLMTDCRSLSKITAIDGPTVIPTSFLEGLILVKEFRIPSTIKEINDFAFRLTSISTINIPASVIGITEGALRDIQIDELTVAEGNSVYHMENGALFQTNHRTLITRVDTTESYTIDKDVTAIYAYAFANHGSMKKLFFEDNEDGVNIGVGAFFSCTNLEEVKLPNNLVTIPDGDFCADLSLKKFTIPATVQTIGIEALSFSNQTAINRINIPAAVTNIGNTAFYASLIDTIDVSWLTPLHLEYDANNQPVFNPKYISNMTLLVPQGTFAAYKAADQWKDFGTIVEKKITDLKETKSIDDILKVSVVNDAMILTTEEPRNVRIVNLAGQTEYTATVNRTVTVSVPNGVHIVQVGNTAIKVIVP